MWTRWHWDRDFPSTSLISCQYHCTNPFACRYNANCVVNQAQPHSLLKVLQANCQCLYKPFWQLSARQKNIGLCFLPASAINLTRTRITVHSFPQALLDDPHCADAPHSHYNLYPQVCQSVAREGEARSRPTSWRRLSRPSVPIIKLTDTLKTPKWVQWRGYVLRRWRHHVGNHTDDNTASHAKEPASINYFGTYRQTSRQCARHLGDRAV
jgi:hypothetical protein